MLTEFHFALHHMSDSSKVLSLDFKAMLRALPAPLETEWQLLRVPHSSDYPDGSAFVPGPALRMPPPDEMEMVRRVAEAVRSHMAPVLAVPIEPSEARGLPTAYACAESELELEIDMPDAPLLTPTPSESGADDASRDGATTPESELKRCRLLHNAMSDHILSKLVLVHGHRWRMISEELGGRAAGWSDDVCRNRYLRISGAPEQARAARQARAPKGPRQVRGAWTAREDAAILSAIDSLRTAASIPWRTIVDALEIQRTPHAIRNRANRMGWTRAHHKT